MNTPHAFPDAWRRGVYEAIARRRDMRHFLPNPVAPQVIARILGAAHQAGSVGFSQPWNFVVVEDRALRQRIHAHVDSERLRAAAGFAGERQDKYLNIKLEGILEAPLNICVTCDRTRFGPAVIGRNTVPETDLYSTCGAVQNLWLAARAEGVGVGWVSILQPAALRGFLGLPDHVEPVAYLCVGYVEDFPERPTFQTNGWLPRLPLQEIVFQDRWGEAPTPALSAALRGSKADRPQLRSGGSGGPHPAHADSRGQLLIYTGDGKGKTTAALGLVFRALGRNLPVAVVQFIKGKWKTGERLFAQTLPQLTFLVIGRGLHLGRATTFRATRPPPKTPGSAPPSLSWPESTALWCWTKLPTP